MPFRNKKGLWKKSKNDLTSTALNQLEKDRVFLEEHSDTIISINLEGEIYDFNQKTLLIFGYPKEIFPCSFEKFIHPNDAKETWLRFENALQGHTEHYSCRVRHNDGHYLWTEITNIPIYEKNMIVGVYGVVRDVSHIEKMRQALSTLESTTKLTEETQGTIHLSFSESGALLKFSSSLQDLLGEKQDFKQLTSKKMIEKWIHPDDKESLFEYIAKVKLDNQNLPAIEIRVRHSKLGYQDVLCKCAVLHATKNDEVTVNCVLHNFSDAKKMEKELDVQKDRLLHVFSIAKNAIFTVNVDTKQVEIFTKEYEFLFNISKTEIENSYFLWEERLHPKDKSDVLLAYSRAIKGEVLDIEYRYLIGKGQYKWIEERLVPERNHENRTTHLQILANDITVIKEQEEQIWDLVMHDGLSGLPNRSLLIQTMEQWMQKHDCFAVASISFNEISKVNETFGYEMGDKWIKQMAEILADRIPANSFLGHLYGDEFLVLLPNVKDENEIQRILQPIFALSRTKIEVSPYEWYPKLTIGVSRYPLDSKAPTELLRFANLALSRLTHLIRGGVEVYASTENIDSYRNFQLSKHLRTAVKDKELFLEFQPKVDSWSGAIVGAEALVRWQHPDWGRISPGQFIPLSEENETHLEITDWVLEEVCKILSNWNKEQKKVIPISINISPKRLMHGNFDEKVIQMIRKYKISPEWIEVEILETDVLGENVKIQEALTNLSKHKIKISLDDFGSGYSSIAYLQKFPIHTLKIDRQFSILVDTDKKTQSLVRSILFMAEEFGLQVVAEGVDKLEQLEVLRKMNCGIIQGFLFSRPVALHVLEKQIADKVILISHELEQSEDYSQALKAEITISYFQGKTIKVGNAPILITSIVYQQIKFISTMRLPVSDEIELLILFPEDLQAQDIIVHPSHAKDLDNGLVEYTASFKRKGDARMVEGKLTHHKKISRKKIFSKDS